MVFYEAPSENWLCTGLESSAWRCLRLRMRQRLVTSMKRLASTGQQALESLFPRKWLHQYLLLIQCQQRQMLQEGDPDVALVRELLRRVLRRTAGAYIQRRTGRVPPVAVKCMITTLASVDNVEQLCTRQHPMRWTLEWRRGRRL